MANLMFTIPTSSKKNPACISVVKLHVHVYIYLEYDETISLIIFHQQRNVNLKKHLH